MKKPTISDLYGVSIFEQKTIINRLQYKGKGRPRKSDYITFMEAQKMMNTLYSQYLDNIRIFTRP